MVWLFAICFERRGDVELKGSGGGKYFYGLASVAICLAASLQNNFAMKKYKNVFSNLSLAYKSIRYRSL